MGTVNNSGGPGSAGRLPRRAVLALPVLAAFAPFAARAQAPGTPPSAPAAMPVIPLVVVARDPIPGFRRDDVAPYLSRQMTAIGPLGWSFTPQLRPPPLPPPARVEWHFELDPYAGGGIRQFFPMPGAKKFFGTRHLITAEAMLYLDDEYQTLMFGQAAISGGADDSELGEFIARMTLGLLGEHGAYRAIDMGPTAPAAP